MSTEDIMELMLKQIGELVVRTDNINKSILLTFRIFIICVTIFAICVSGFYFLGQGYPDTSQTTVTDGTTTMVQQASTKGGDN